MALAELLVDKSITMTQTEQLVAPLGTTTRIKNASPTMGETGTRVPWTSYLLLGAILVLALYGGIWWYTHGRTTELQLSAVNAVLVSGATILLAILGTHWLTQRSWTRHLAARAAEREGIESRWRNQLTEHTCREQQLWSEQNRLTEKVTVLLRDNAGLTEELDRRRQAERKFSMLRQDLVRSNDVLELHVQARTQELQKFQRRYELILESAGEGICGLGVEGRISFANPAAARIMGEAVERMIGRPITDLIPGIHGSQVVDAASAGAPSEICVNRMDGSNIVLEYFRSPICEGSRTVGDVLLFKDITERKQTETALAHKAAELARSNAELEQFAFVASHDLQEPLRKIQAFGDRLKVKCESLSLGEGKEYLERMQNAAARMRTLIDDLLTFSRVISRTEPFTPVDLNRVVREVLNDLEVRIEKNGVKLEVGELPTIDADPMQMRQLLQNLIGNALKFHEPGAKPVVHIAGKILPAAAESTETAMLRRRGPKGEAPRVQQFCEVTVQDNGIGFDEKYLDRIFAVFQRLHGRQEYEGTGIGLAVCRRIVDRHGGTLTAKSKPGQGAMFIVTLPMQPPRPTAKTE